MTLGAWRYLKFWRYAMVPFLGTLIRLGSALRGLGMFDSRNGNDEVVLGFVLLFDGFVEMKVEI